MRLSENYRHYSEPVIEITPSPYWKDLKKHTDEQKHTNEHEQHTNELEKHTDEIRAAESDTEDEESNFQIGVSHSWS